jgi:Leucine-rich repeat (LRR) protein
MDSQQVTWDDDHVDFSEISQNTRQLLLKPSETKLLSNIFGGADFTFCFLQVIKLSRVGLKSISGLYQNTFPALRELYCAFNEIQHLDALFGYTSIEVLDFEGNEISDPSNLIPLSTIPNLRELNLASNPIMIRAAADLTDPEWISSKLPQLEYLNDESLIADTRAISTASTTDNHQSEISTIKYMQQESSRSAEKLPARPAAVKLPPLRAKKFD